MKILNITHTSHLGGAEISMLRLLEGFKSSCTVILFEDGDLKSELERLNIEVIVIELPQRLIKFKRNSFNLLRALFLLPELAEVVQELHRKIEKVNPDVIHLNTIKAALVFSFIQKKVKRPSIWHIRDAWIPSYMPMPQRAFLRLMARRFEGVIANSSFTLKHTSRHDGVVIPSGLPKTHCNWKVNNRVERGQNLLLLGRISPWKGQHVAIEALVRMNDSYRLRIVGSAMFQESDYKDSLTELIEYHNLNGRVEFVEFTKNTCSQFQWANIVLHTSVSPEPFGNVVIEAMSHGVPIIATLGGGPEEIICNKFDGILVKPGDSKELATAILELGADKDLYLSISNNSLETSKKYSSDKIQMQFLRYLQQIGNQGFGKKC